MHFIFRSCIPGLISSHLKITNIVKQEVSGIREIFHSRCNETNTSQNSRAQYGRNFFLISLQRFKKYCEGLQRRIQNPVKHLRWRVLRN